MKTLYALAFTTLLALASPAYAAEEAAATPAAEPTYTAAVLPFKAGMELEEMSADASVLISAFLSTKSGLMTVERAEVDKALSEIELGKSGTVDEATAARVGHLLGAQVIVTGSTILVQKEVTIVAKIIGVETGAAFGEMVSMPLRGNIKDAALELSDKIAATIAAKGGKLVAPASKKEDLVAKLKPLLEGRKLPTVSILIDAMNINRTDTDEAAQTELAFILEKLGFTIIDTMASNKKADVEVTGKAISEFALRKGNLVSAKANIELKAINHADGKVLLVDRESSVAVDLAPEMAGKQAQQKGATALAERLVKALVDAK
jgi:TolB-like protein